MAKAAETLFYSDAASRSCNGPRTTVNEFHYYVILDDIMLN